MARTTPSTTTATTTPKKAKTAVVLTAKQAAAVAAAARPAESPCLCGCGQLTKGRFFPGHDATLKSALAATVKAGGPAAKHAKAALATFGW